MPRISHAAPLALALISWPAAASADWQYTTWRMTPDQVIAAADGTVRSVQGRPGDRVFNADLRAEGTYSAAGFDFRAQFYFDTASRLRVVRLVMDDFSRCAELERTLAGLYGSPIARDRLGMGTTSAVWTDVANSNQVRFTSTSGYGPSIPDSCLVAYTPIASEGASGL